MALPTTFEGAFQSPLYDRPEDRVRRMQQMRQPLPDTQGFGPSIDPPAASFPTEEAYQEWQNRQALPVNPEPSISARPLPEPPPQAEPQATPDSPRAPRKGPMRGPKSPPPKQPVSSPGSFQGMAPGIDRPAYTFGSQGEQQAWNDRPAMSQEDYANASGIGNQPSMRDPNAPMPSPAPQAPFRAELSPEQEAQMQQHGAQMEEQARNGFRRPGVPAPQAAADMAQPPVEVPPVNRYEGEMDWDNPTGWDSTASGGPAAPIPDAPKSDRPKPEEPKPAPAPAPESRPEDLSPLPGEETLPDQVRAWARYRSAEDPTALDRMKIRWQRERGEKTSNHETFEDWLAANVQLQEGEDLDSAMNRLSQESDEFIKSREKWGTWSWDAKNNKPAFEKNERYHQTMDGISRNRWMRENSKRFAGMATPAELSKAYEMGMEEARAAVEAGTIGPREMDAFARYRANQNFLEPMRNAGLQRRTLAVHDRAAQRHRAQRFGISEGMVAALDDLAAADTPEAQFRSLMFMHQMYPQAGYGGIGQMLMRGQIDSQQLAQWAKTFGPKEQSYEADAARTNAMPNDANKANSHRMNARRSLGDKATPEQIEETTRQLASGDVSNLVGPHASGTRQMTPDEIAFARNIIGDMSLREFMEYTGLDLYNPYHVHTYYTITGQQPGVGNHLGALGSWGIGGPGARGLNPFAPRGGDASGTPQIPVTPATPAAGS